MVTFKRAGLVLSSHASRPYSCGAGCLHRSAERGSHTEGQQLWQQRARPPTCLTRCGTKPQDPLGSRWGQASLRGDAWEVLRAETEDPRREQKKHMFGRFENPVVPDLRGRPSGESPPELAPQTDPRATVPGAEQRVVRRAAAAT